jgi:hypothetical protein
VRLSVAQAPPDANPAMMCARTATKTDRGRTFPDDVRAEASFGSAGLGWRPWVRAVAILMMWATVSVGMAMARDPDPVLHIPLEPMGYQTMLTEFLASGSSMVTVHFVDKDHLLVTFSLRRLMKREVDDPQTDDDHTIGAFLVEIPSGKVVARTEWRAHDRGQYLWDLGRGRFLLRVRDHLRVFAPDAAKPKEAFREYPFLQIERHILAILVSADDDLLTVETVDPTVAKAQDNNSLYGGGGPKQTDLVPVQINFYRISSEAPTDDRSLAASSGALRSRVALALPLTTAGFLEVLEGGRDRWLFNFDPPTGKVSELAQFDTTCYPHLTFVSHSEFVAFGCRGTIDKQDIAGFNLKGDAMWQQNFFDTHIAPEFAFAPRAGRFALERTIVGAVDPGSTLASGGVNAQEVRVYQSYSGKLLFRTACTPVVRAGQNFALSEDGMRLAVLRETTQDHKATKDYDAYTSRTAVVEIYTLPGLTGKDEAAVKEAQGFAPKDTGGSIDLALRRMSGQAAANEAADSAAADAFGSGPAMADPAAAAVPAADSSQAAASTLGDPDPAVPRKPPTLYGPDESPGGKPSQ